MSVRALVRKISTTVGYWFFPKVSTASALRFKVLGESAHYFVGYHDHDPLSSDGEFVLCHRVDRKFTETIEPEEGEVGLMSVANGKFFVLARVRALNWQLGSRVQWLDNNRIIYNDIVNGLQCSVVLDSRSGKCHNVIPWPFWAVSPDKQLGVSLNFSVLSEKRPGYGYCGASPDGDRDILRVFDLESHRVVFEHDLSEIAEQLEIEFPENRAGYLNHVCWNHSSNKFVTVLSWESSVLRRRVIYGILVDLESSTFKILNSSGFFSHLTWLNDESLIAFVEVNGRRAYQMWCEADGWSELIGFPHEDGHPTIDADGNAVYVDSYPDRFSRIDLFRCSLKSDDAPSKLLTVAHNPQYTGPLRCDLHPRFSAMHKKLVCDTSSYGMRKILLLDV